ncbi:Glutamine cyclotransferase [Bordetella sputigena]|uniref:Vgb family protein n=1 Tax=Bordetella sputigena TaxID=1416810 RepID=UPI0039F12FFE
MNKPAEIIRELGPFPGVSAVHGLTYDGQHVWFASGDRLNCIDPGNGATLRTIEVEASAGTAYDGKHIYQIAGERIQKVDPKTGAVAGSIPTPAAGCSGMAWAEGFLWVAHYRERKIHQVDPATGKVLRSIESNRFVTGITWVDDQLWHGTWEEDASELRQICPETGEVIQQLDMPAGIHISGIESDGRDLIFCGGGPSGKIRVVRRPSIR